MPVTRTYRQEQDTNFTPCNHSLFDGRELPIRYINFIPIVKGHYQQRSCIDFWCTASKQRNIAYGVEFEIAMDISSRHGLAGIMIVEDVPIKKKTPSLYYL
jgi:hypothetical protein